MATVLASSYADVDFREALALLDGRVIQNSAGTRRQLRLDLQREVIESNGEVIDEFGRVAEVTFRNSTVVKSHSNSCIASPAHRQHTCEAEYDPRGDEAASCRRT